MFGKYSGAMIAVGLSLLFSDLARAQQNFTIDEENQMMRQACTRIWEQYTSEFDYPSNGDLWLSDLADKANFIKYVSEWLRASNGEMLVKSFNSAEDIIYYCGANRFNLFTSIKSQAETDKAYFEAVIIQQNDLDLDGVTNPYDLCINTDPGLSVDSDGCADNQKDTDGDGVTDDIDECDGTDPNDATTNEEGCSIPQLDQIDSDGDGTPDYLDAYPHQGGSQCYP